MNSSGTLKIARNGYIVIAVVFCALGIFLMAVPEKAVKIICVLAGILPEIFTVWLFNLTLALEFS